MKKYLVALACSTAVIAGSVFADMPGRHPAYIHALSDLHAAKWLLENSPGNPNVGADEGVAIQHINAAIANLKNAAYYDGKDLNYHPVADTPNDPRGRVHRALDLLRKVHSDVARPEDDPVAQPYQSASIHEIDGAIDATKHAVYDTEMGNE